MALTIREEVVGNDKRFIEVNQQLRARLSPFKGFSPPTSNHGQEYLKSQRYLISRSSNDEMATFRLICRFPISAFLISSPMAPFGDSQNRGRFSLGARRLTTVMRPGGPRPSNTERNANLAAASGTIVKPENHSFSAVK